ncbi:hypothetical protein LOAG_14015 [Loa loa]|uniref:Zinc finger protein n=1 Tax=Loa loa TaxID=7209 RepID=A0A1S0TJU5_LOALO|nr:hypothetical protein LOAG_14015 [Loa loa]EFO14503.1 hypothetical protein LOAG_14015 [Loa loa]
MDQEGISRLKEHTTHTSEKRSKCEISKKDFAASSSLRTQTRIHIENMRSHMKIHDNRDSTAPYAIKEILFEITHEESHDGLIDAF